MNYKILFPRHPFNHKEVDDEFKPEANICKLIGLDYYLFDYDLFVETGKLKSNIIFGNFEIIIYRGWMLSPDQYSSLRILVMNKSAFMVRFINSGDDYEHLHCFPMVYDHISQYTPRILELKSWRHIYTEDIEFDFFIKDHVKSNKTADGVEKISKDISKNDLVDKIGEFVKNRGKLFTGNIVLKEFVDLKKINGKTNEWRVFYTNKEIVTYFQNSYLKTTEHPPLSLIREVGDRLSHLSQFFTVDFALTESNEWILIETGDGQVSGLIPGEELSFYTKLLEKLNI